MENHHHTQQDRVYICPMHPEITGNKDDKCPSGMELQPIPKEAGEVQVNLTTQPEQVAAGKPTLLIIKIEKDKAIAPLEVSHEMKLHLMIVSEGLDYFRHVHPEEQSNGGFVIEETFPEGGNYLLFVDYKPKASKPALAKLALKVEGKPVSDKPAVSEKFVSDVDGYGVVLENGNNFKSHRTQALKFSIEKGGNKVLEKDLQQYLGANAHIVMIGKSDKEYLHIHPMNNPDFPVYAESFIEKPGIYMVWVQFQTNGQVHTADFTVQVKQGAEDKSVRSHKHHQH